MRFGLLFYDMYYNTAMQVMLRYTMYILFNLWFYCVELGREGGISSDLIPGPVRSSEQVWQTLIIQS